MSISRNSDISIVFGMLMCWLCGGWFFGMKC